MAVTDWTDRSGNAAAGLPHGSAADSPGGGTMSHRNALIASAGLTFIIALSLILGRDQLFEANAEPAANGVTPVVPTASTEEIQVDGGGTVDEMLDPAADEHTYDDDDDDYWDEHDDSDHDPQLAERERDRRDRGDWDDDDHDEHDENHDDDD